jgi:penicillin-binding protein 1A
MALVSVEPTTGYVTAMVGGRDFAVSQVNNALGADGGGTGRQPGSAFKPFVLATAFAQGITPSRTYSGEPFMIGDDLIENYDGASYGLMDLRSATTESVNAVFARLILDVGVDQTMAMASTMGLDMPPYDPAKYGASVALGAIEVSPLQMASAFGVFANRGVRAEPTPVLQVVAPDGTVVLDHTGARDAAAPVIPEVVADNVTDVLTGVLTTGTATGKGIGRPAAGKTGTSENNANAWFVGYTPALSTAVWLGYESANIPLVDIHGIPAVTGGTIPATVWQQYMETVLSTIEPTDFTDPAPIRSIADDANLEEPAAFDAGRRQYPARPPTSGPYVYGLEPPEVEAPTTTTTEPPRPTTSTTSTSTSTSTTTTTTTTTGG